MKKSQAIAGCGAALGMLLLILDTKTALAGAQEGLEMCIRTVIPSLFPFFILSILLTSSLNGAPIPLLRPIGKFLGIPEGNESILAVGFLGGYPVGAQSIRDAWSRGQLQDKDARRMLSFCNNAGPAFLFGMASSLFPYGWMPWALWCIHILSAFLVALLIPGKPEPAIAPGSTKPLTVTASMTQAVRIMAQVCGWVMVFRVIIAFFARWFGWLMPTSAQVILSGLLELSNGCCSLVSVENVGLRFVICSGFLAFGGLCVTLQTMSAAEGLDMGLYFPGKLLQTALSFSFSCLIQFRLPADMVWKIPVIIPIILALLTIFPPLLVKIRNRSGNPAILGV